MNCSHLSCLRRPTGDTKIFKDECTKCFDNDESSNGLNVCLTCYNGGCTGDLEHSKIHFLHTSHAIVLNIKRVKLLEESLKSDDQNQKITKIAIGVSGGLQNGPQPKYDITTRVLCFACNSEVPLNEELSEIVKYILKSDSALRKQQLDSTWELETVSCEHILMLKQNVYLPQFADRNRDYKCWHKCEWKENLWLCMTCGNLGCGRKNFDGTGANNHAVEHHQKTGHPVVCQMGTITPEGTADIFCYACDETRKDDKLMEHLRSFGIKIEGCEKSAKTIAELTLEANLAHNWSQNLEEGKDTELLYGPQFTGLENIGNNCYMSSILQIIFSIPSFQKLYQTNKESNHLLDCNVEVSANCLQCQLWKLCHGLMSGRYSLIPKEDNKEKKVQPGIPPRMFKHLFTINHSLFRTSQQQDALEFFQYTLQQIQREERIRNRDPTSIFNFKIENRIQCLVCNRVKYTVEKNTDVSLPLYNELINFDNNNDGEIELLECLKEWSNSGVVENFNCSNCNKRTTAKSSLKFKTFPSFMLISMKRFQYGDHFVPKKIDAAVNTPLKIDLSDFVSSDKEKEKNEVVLLETKSSSKVSVSDTFMTELISMGFEKDLAIRALQATNNVGSEPALNWLLQGQGSQGSSDINQQDDSNIVQLVSMGFSENHVKYALSETSGNVDRALDWLFSHASEPLPKKNNENNNNQINEVNDDDNNQDQTPIYELFGFVTHLGKSTGSGHYVAHVLRNGRWVFFNDSKVSASVVLPKHRAYLYVFRKCK